MRGQGPRLSSRPVMCPLLKGCCGAKVGRQRRRVAVVHAPILRRWVARVMRRGEGDIREERLCRARDCAGSRWRHRRTACWRKRVPSRSRYNLPSGPRSSSGTLRWFDMPPNMRLRPCWKLLSQDGLPVVPLARCERRKAATAQQLPQGRVSLHVHRDAEEALARVEHGSAGDAHCPALRAPDSRRVLKLKPSAARRSIFGVWM